MASKEEMGCGAEEPDDKPLYNSRIIDTYIKLIQKRYSHVDVAQLLAFAQMQPHEVSDQGHWFTQQQVNRFHQKLSQLSGNPGIAREAGRYAASSETLGAMRQHLLGMVNPAKALDLVGQGAAHMTRSARYQSRRVNANQVEVVVTPHPGVKEEPFQCHNRAGFFESLTLLFNKKLPEIEHPECLFEGGAACRYLITWKNTRLPDCRRFRMAVIPLLGFISAFGIYVNPHVGLTQVLPVTLITYLVLTVLCLTNERKELRESLESLFDSSDKLLSQINVNYNTARMSHEIGQVISEKTEKTAVLESVVNILKNRLDYDRGLVLLADSEKTSLEYAAGFGYADLLIERVKDTGFSLKRKIPMGVFTTSFWNQQPYLVNDVEKLSEQISSRSLALAREAGVNAFICCPIVCEGKSIGLLAVDNCRTERPLVQSDMNLLMGIAPVIGISIRNSEHQEARTRQLASTMMVLAASIDARDHLTAGHSVLVTEYAVGIAQELGLGDEEVEMIRLAALLHDYGKLAVPDSILKKPDKLTAEEFEVIKTHSEKTREILQQIDFEGIYTQVPEVAAAHHEKMDGSGYPLGLKGEEIPLGARIIAVADFFEAITAKRHYREPMPLAKAFRLLHEESGIHLDSDAVTAFCAYFQKTYKIDVLDPQAVLA